MVKQSFSGLLLLPIFIVLLVACSGSGKSTVQSVNDSIAMTPIVIDPDYVNRLMPYRGVVKKGIGYRNPENTFAPFWTVKWKTPDQSVNWKITTDKDEYSAELLVRVSNLASGESASLQLSNGTDSVACLISSSEWQRCRFPRNIKFKKGTSVLSLKISEPGCQDNFDVNLFSLELVKPAVREKMTAEAQSLRSDTSWMADITYGFFFHWNSKSMPQTGEQLPYEQAVDNFDVERFAQTVHECGGKLVFFTTSWAEYYFPAPIRAIDNILPGRTTKRDLVADLSRALEKYGIRLILYYHVGHGDQGWMSAQNSIKDYSDSNIGDVFVNIEKIVAEISQRYGDKLSGLWLDDGRCYYANGVRFENVAKAAKSGNKDMVLCFNPWVLPRMTDFQDFFAGETGLNLGSAGVDNPYLPEGGDGKFKGGPHDGLQATFCGLLEPGEWTHIYKNSNIEDPLLSIDDLTKMVEEADKRKNVPMMNVRIYQDGTISPVSYELLKELNLRINNE